MRIGGLDMKLRFRKPAGASSPLLTGLVSSWKLDEESGTRADSHGSNDLTDNNTVGYTAGKDGNAAECLNSNFESLGGGDYFDFSGSFTISFWFNPVTVVNGRYFFTRYLPSVAWAAYNNINKPTFVVSDGSPVSAASTVTISADTWYHCVCWYDSSDKKGYISVNGETPASSSALSSTILNGSGLFYINKADTVACNNCRYDEFSVWNRVLTSQERTDLYNSGAGLDYPFTG